MTAPAASLRLGAHMSIAGGLHKALLAGAEAGCQVVQVFTKSNKQWAPPRQLSDDELELWFATRQETGVQPALAHGSYLVNLGSPDPAAWKRSLQALSEEYNRCQLLQIPALVIHPGAHLGSGEVEGIARIALALDRLLAEQPQNPTLLLLENTAGQGTNLGYRFEHLRDLLAAVLRSERLGVCIDTCHTLAANYDLRTPSGWQETFSEFERVVGTGWIKAFHVNDSKTPLGSRKDRHELLGRGHLGLRALHCLVNDSRFTGLPMVLETPKPSPYSDQLNLEILRALAGRQRVTARAKKLASQPAEAPPLS